MTNQAVWIIVGVTTGAGVAVLQPSIKKRKARRVPGFILSTE